MAPPTLHDWLGLAPRRGLRRMLAVLAGMLLAFGGLMLVGALAFTYAERRALQDEARLAAQGVELVAEVLAKDKGSGRLPLRTVRVRFAAPGGQEHETTLSVNDASLWNRLYVGGRVSLRVNAANLDHARLRDDDEPPEPMDLAELALLYGAAAFLLLGAAGAWWLRRRLPPA